MDLDDGEPAKPLADQIAELHAGIQQLQIQQAHARGSGAQKPPPQPPQLPSVPQLQGAGNIYKWCVSIQSHLDSLGLFHHALGPVPPPQGEPERSQWARDQATCFGVIWNTATPVHSRIEHCGYVPGTDPHALWTAIMKTYNSLGLVELKLIYARLKGLDRAAYPSTGALLNEFRRIRDCAGFHIADDMLAAYLICAFESTHQHIYKNHFRVRDAPISLDAVLSDLTRIEVAERTGERLVWHEGL